MLAEVELKLENAKNIFCDTLEEMVEGFVAEVYVETFPKEHSWELQLCP